MNFDQNINPEIKFVPKGWGFEKWIVNCDEYCGNLSRVSDALGTITN